MYFADHHLRQFENGGIFYFFIKEVNHLVMKKLVPAFSRFMERYLPDAFIFATILTFITFLAAWLGMGIAPKNILLGWGNGFFNLLAFSCQMSLITIFGYAMCKTPAFSKLIKKVATLSKTPGGAMAVLGAVSVIASFINWGIGIVLPAMLAREQCRNIKGIDYRMSIGVAFGGAITAGAGLSSPVFLQLALTGHLNQILPDLFAANFLVPMNQTIFSGFNLTFVIAWLIALPLLGKYLHPTDESQIVVADPAVLVEAPIVKDTRKFKEKSPAERLEQSKILHYLLIAMGFYYIIWHFSTKGFDVTINILILVLLFVGLLLTDNLINYVRTMGQVTNVAAGILLTFPFYAGIQAMMSVRNTDNQSLAIVFSKMFVSISTVRTFPLWTLVSAAFVNLFIPSGGGQWFVQGPIMLRAANELGANIIKTAAAQSYGDQITNLIQPFWMLPALSIAKLKARDIMGFLLVAFFVGFAIMALVLAFIPPF